jgi:hypothetical protein
VPQIQCNVSTENYSFPRQYVPIYIKVGANKKRHGTIPVVPSSDMVSAQQIKKKFPVSFLQNK